ncbi:MAG: hypothetical protein IJS28_10090 [Synergistaceae bacterium]|nr:hypothetical protein [Synergistaceae bacterium]
MCGVNEAELTDLDLQEGLFSRAQFILLASPGAQGELGAVKVVTDDGKSYHGNYVYGSVNKSVLLKAFEFANISPDEFNEKWCSRYLGCGNTLFLRRVHNDKYLELLGDKADGFGTEYGCWNEIAVNLLSRQH